VPSGDLVLVERDDVAGTALITLNRPESRNALNPALLGELRAALADVASADTGAVVLTGADPAFCAGLDLKELSGGNSNLLDSGTGPEGYPWEPLDIPVIGAVNGVAVTGGLEIALNCDFLIASDRARFADTHARVGILPAWGLSVLLPERVGFSMARRMSTTGDFIDAAEALRAGLVTQVVNHEKLIPTALGLAATIASNHRPAVRALLSSYRQVESEFAAGAHQVELTNATRWRRAGGTEGVADRVPGVFDRGRTQNAGEQKPSEWDSPAALPCPDAP
jgi:enoyl-CoA hydratase